MEQLFNSLKASFKKSTKSIQVISGFITVLVGLSVLITKAFESKYTIAIICIGLFFIIIKFCTDIITEKGESFGVIKNKYSNKNIRIAKTAKISAFLFWIFPIYVGINHFSKPNNCEKLLPTLGLLITSFTDSNSDDDFSYKLFNVLQNELQSTDTITTIRLKKFVSIGCKDYLDSIDNEFDSNCLSKGLLVFGKRSQQSKLLDCNIYINNLVNLNKDNKRVKDKAIIYLQNPDLINFSIEYQAKAISEFILALLYYNANKFSISRDKFYHSLSLNSNRGNEKFNSYCHLYIGNSLYKEGKNSDAIKTYQTGIHNDSLNAYLHYNLATTLLENSDSIRAYKEFVLANALNKKLANPIQNLSTTNHRGKCFNLNPSNAGPTLHNTPKISLDIDNASTSDESNSEYTVIVKEGKYGVINKKSDTLIKCTYDYIDQFVFNYKGRKYFIVKKGDLFGAVNHKGSLEFPVKHRSIENIENAIKAVMELEAAGENNLNL